MFVSTTHATIPFEGNHIFELIGQQTGGEAMQQLKQFLEEDPSTKFSETVWFSRKKGLEVGLKQGKVTRIFIHGKSPYNYGTQPFVGKVPLEIDFTNSTDQIIRKLGEPAERKSWGALLYYVKHHDHRYYTSFEMNADKQSIKYIFIKKDVADHQPTIRSENFGKVGKTILNTSEGGDLSITAGEEDAKKTGCVKGDCANGIGTFLWNSGSKYVGEYKNGQRNGFGTLYYDNGDVFIGEWVTNKQEGNGVYAYSTKGSYKLYSGEWKNGKRAGFGLMIYKNGTQRIGMWKEGVFTKIEQKGCVSGDCKNQQSEYVWSDDGSRFVGKYVNGQRNGLGVYYYGKGGKYAGEFKDGKRNGQGTYYFPNGSKYVGTWRNDMREGYGTLYQKGGKVIRGTWHNGKLSKR